MSTATQPQHALRPGSLLQNGKYRIVRFISTGGFSCTYEAQHTVFDERVAIKELFVGDFCNRDAVTGMVTVGTLSKKPLIDRIHRKFLDEAKALRKLHHPGIVAVSDVFDENGTAYYVMDYIDGSSLSDMLKRSGSPLPPVQALDYIHQAGEALKYVHANNRLHLDIKPANIMIESATGRAILIDFGTSKHYDEQSGQNTSTLLGHTPGFASPEQYSGDMSLFTPASDVYSLGATLYKLLTGNTPPDAAKRFAGTPLPPLPGNIPPWVGNAIVSAMSLDKKLRPQGISDFLSQLSQPSPRTAAESNETTLLDPHSPKSEEKPGPKWADDDEESDTGGGSKLPRLILLLLLLVIVGAIVFYRYTMAEDIRNTEVPQRNDEVITEKDKQDDLLDEYWADWERMNDSLCWKMRLDSLERVDGGRILDADRE